MSNAVACSQGPHRRTSTAATLLGWGLFAGIGTLGIATTILVTRNAYRHLQQAQRSGVQAGILAAAAGLVTFAGGWLFVVAAWVARGGSRALRRTDDPIRTANRAP